MNRTVRWLLGTVVLLAALVGATPAYAALSQGSWTAPTAGSTVRFTVQLEFQTSNSAVTFVLPGGNVAATVSNGYATAQWDTTKAKDGQVTIGAQECDVTGCSTTNTTVTVDNPTTPVFSPASGTTVHPGDAITVTGNANGDGQLQLEALVSQGDAVLQTLVNGTVTLPYVLTVPKEAPGDYNVSFYVGGSNYGTAGYDFTVPRTTGPKLTHLQAAGRYFPYRDGYEDSFGISFLSDETGAAHLYILKGKKIVARGLTRIPFAGGSPVYASAGGGLKPGTYSWFLSVTDSAGRTTRTKVKPLVADPRKQVRVQRNPTLAATSVAHESAAGACSSARDSGGSIVLTSRTSCGRSGKDVDLALTTFRVQIPKDVLYDVAFGVDVTGSTVGVVAFEGDTTQVVTSGAITPGSGELLDIDAGFLDAKHRFFFAVGTGGGRSATISHVLVDYSELVLVRP